MLNTYLSGARNEIINCQKLTNETVEYLTVILENFASDAHVEELFMKTGFGKIEEKELRSILDKLIKIENALDSYVPKTISTIEYQMKLNEENGQ